MDLASRAVIVVGGGLGGLAAAVQLGRLGIPALLFEGAREIGGRARTECRDGFYLNVGPHRLYERGAAVMELRNLGVHVDAARRGPNGGVAIWRGRKHTLPVGCCSLMTTGLFAPPGKREIARFLTAIRTTDAAALQGTPFEAWLQVQLRDPRVLEMVRAFVRFATYCAEPDRQSAGAAIDQLRLCLTGSVLYVHHGWGTLVAGLRKAAEAAGATIVTDRIVIAVNAIAGRAESVTLENGAVVGARAVILATDPRQADRLLGSASAPRFTTTPVCVAALDVALRRLPMPRTVFALGVDDPVCFSADSVIARVAPVGGAVVHLARHLRTGATGSPEDEQRLERTLDLLQPGWRELVVHRRFIPTAVAGNALVAARTGGFAGRPTGRLADLDNVFLAGDWVGPIGQLADASVSSGIQAARNVGRLIAAS